MQHDLLKLTAKIFTSAQDIVAFEKSKRKNLNYSGIQKLKKDAAEQWEFLTSAYKESAVVVHVEAAERKKISYGFSFKDGLYSVPVFGPPMESATYAIPADFRSMTAQTRLDKVAGNLNGFAGRFGPQGRKRAVDLAVNDAEVNYYAATAYGASDEVATPFENKAYETLSLLDEELRLNYRTVGLKESLEESLKPIAKRPAFN